MSLAEPDEQITIRTIFDLQMFDPKAGTALFRQRITPGRQGRSHSFAMEASDWDALGQPKAIAMTFSPEKPPI
jgi:hypothetical protein